MEWTVGEICGLIADDVPAALQKLMDGCPPMPVRVIHVAPGKVIVTPNLDPVDERMMYAVNMVETLGLGEPSYLKKSFDPETGKELNPGGPYSFKLIKRS